MTFKLLNIQIQNFEFFWKLNFRTQFVIFWQCVYNTYKR